MRRNHRRGLLVVAVTAALLSALTTVAAALERDDSVLNRRTEFYVAPDGRHATQAQAYRSEGRLADAALMDEVARHPIATWLTGGTPQAAADTVRDVIAGATARELRGNNKVPVFMIYYVPGRDCSQYSSGGATSEQLYKDWVDAVAAAIGSARAVVLIEADGTALLSSEPWCGQGGGGFTGQPEDFGLVEQRFRELNHAVDAFQALPLVDTYIDAGHSDWHGLNDYDAGYGVPNLQFGIVNRLRLAGIERADGFLLNTSNYRSTAELVAYGSRVSQCLAWVEADPDAPRPAVYDPQPGSPCPPDAALDAIPVTAATKKTLTHFVLDTSRNGQGPWNLGDPTTHNDDNAAFEQLYGLATTDPEVWCNPPQRGMGARPTTDTGHPLVDAFLWVKVPGESDGSCTRNLVSRPAGMHPSFDVVWNRIDPGAGQWWPDQALQLARLADPPFLP